MEELDLSNLLHDRVQDFRNRFSERKFIQEIEEEVAIRGDALLLQLLINNLLENAIKYSPKEKIISCRLLQTGNTVLLTVTDEGTGIPDEEKSRIFDKFYRIGSEATRKTQGTGLGLYLCRKIAADHNADISVTNNVPSGSIFTVHFKNI
jgi:two-component system, OmpR family, sensor histidine kinase CiaH